MKSLQEFITEKIQVKKNASTSYDITFEQLRMLFLYCVCFLKEEDLLDEDFIQWGEMERYTKYKIDFYKDEDCKWISDYGIGDGHEEIRNIMDEIGDDFMSIMRNMVMHNKNIEFSTGILTKIAFFILEYIDKYQSDSKIDFSKIKRIETDVNGVDISFVYPERFWKDSIFGTVRNAESIINNIYVKSKDLMNM